jgi:hypothetical protein
LVVDTSKHKIRALKLFRYVTILFTLLLLASASEAQNDTMQWYQSGQKEVWHTQHDVFAFRTKSLTAMQLNGYNDILNHHYCRSNHSDKMNIVYFKADASEQQIESFKNYIKAESDFDVVFPVITKLPELPATDAKWLLVDDYLMIKFKDANIPVATFNDFRLRYSLLWQNPEIKQYSSGNPTYIFSFDIHSGKANNVVTLAKKIYEQDSSIIEQAIPNKIMAFQAIPAENTGTVTLIINEGNVEGKDYYIHLNNAEILKVFFRNKNIAKKKEFKIFDAMGQLLFSKPVSAYEINEYYLRIHDYAPGIYFTMIEEVGGNMLHFQRFKK